MMEEKRKKVLEGQLHSQEKKIKEQLQHFKKGLDFGNDTDHLEEEADETEEFGTWIGLKRVLEHHLDRIRRALAKIGVGNYGHCERCGKEIESTLLDIDPESALCMSCKKKEGKKR